VRPLKLLQLELPFLKAPAEAVERKIIVFGSEPLDYTVKRSRKRRRIVITIDEDGIRVGAPWRASDRSIVEVLSENAEWVLKTAHEWQRRRAPKPKWCDGERLSYLGAPLVLRLRNTVAPAVFENGELWITGDPSDPAKVAAEVRRWLAERALHLFRERAHSFAGRLGIGVPAVHLSNARTRWGSCNANGNVRINWRLVQMPLELVDYVVAHELAHLLQMNHSERFWRTVARIYPDYAWARRRIRTEGHTYLRF
jgi:predicted metal-dependent hydrolase